MERILAVLFPLSTLIALAALLPDYSAVMMQNADLAPVHLAIQLAAFLFWLRMGAGGEGWAGRNAKYFVLLSLIFFAWFAWKVLPFKRTPIAREGRSSEIVLYTADVRGVTVRPLAALGVADRADAVVLSGISPEWASSLGAEKNFPVKIVRMAANAQPGTAILSRFPSLPGAELNRGFEDTSFLRTRLDLRGNEDPSAAERRPELVELSFLKIDREVVKDDYAGSRLLARRASAAVRHAPNPVIVIADVGSTPFSNFYSGMLHVGRLDDGADGHGMPVFDGISLWALYRGCIKMDARKHDAYGLLFTAQIFEQATPESCGPSLRHSRGRLF